MLVIGIESTCDETGCSLVKDGKEILSNVVSSQIDLHNLYGGVVPELACRRHIDVIIPVIHEALEKAGVTLDDVDAIAVAQGPGLIGALLIGINAAKAIAFALGKPLIGVNHVEAHLYASLMEVDSVEFPALGVVLSGGHTALIKMDNLGSYQLIGQTVDDALGEAYDKVAKMLGLRYPGGPEVEKLALKGDPKAFSFTAGRVKTNPLAFSFSGMKTAVLYAIQGIESMTDQNKNDIAATFQETALRDVLKKALLAAEEHSCKTLVFGGGVCNNKRLRALFEINSQDKTLLFPPAALTLDNAAMIAGLGYHKLQVNGPASLDLEAKTSMPLSL